jgi:hypothetical protein
MEALAGVQLEHFTYEDLGQIEARARKETSTNPAGEPGYAIILAMTNLVQVIKFGANDELVSDEDFRRLVVAALGST